MNKKIIILLFLSLTILVTGCNKENNNNDDKKSIFEENETINAINKSMTVDEMKNYFSLTVKTQEYYYGEISYRIGYDGKKTDLKKNMYEAYFFYDKDNSNVYIIDSDRNNKYIKTIGENKLKEYSIEDITNDSNLQYELCTINEYSVEEYGDTNELYLRAKGKPNSDKDYCVFEITEDDDRFLFSNGYHYSHYFFSEYYKASEYLSDRYNDMESKTQKSKPKVGMTAGEVKATSWGSPDKINTRENYSGVHEQWVYKKHGYVYLDDGVVTSISESN